MQRKNVYEFIFKIFILLYYIELLNMLSIEFSVFFVVSLFFFIISSLKRFRFCKILFVCCTPFSCGAVLREKKRVKFAPLRLGREKEKIILS